MNNTDLEKRVETLEKMHLYGGVAIAVLLVYLIIRKK